MAEVTIGGGSGLIPRSVLEAHSLAPNSFERRMRITAELQAAAAAGDTARVRALKAEREDLDRMEAQETANLLSQAASRELKPPAKGEETRLTKRAKQIECEIARKQRQHEKLLARLRRAPENEELPDRIDLLRSQVHDLSAEQQAVEARLTEIEKDRADERKWQELSARQHEWERLAPRYRLELETAVTAVIAAWEKLDSGMREVDRLRDLLRAPISPAESPQTTAAVMRIADGTKGAVQSLGGRWIVRLYDAEVRR